MTAAHAARRGQRTASDVGLEILEPTTAEDGTRRIAAVNYPPRVQVAAAAHRLGIQLAEHRAEQTVTGPRRGPLAQVRATWGPR